MLTEEWLLLPFILAIGSLVYWTLALGIGPTPSSKKVIQCLQTALPQDVKGDIVELGCGWGHLLPMLQKTYPENQVIGYERSPIPFYFCTLFHPKVTLRHQDIYTANLSNAGLVVCYLCREGMRRFETELLPYLPEGCHIVTHTFAMPSTPPTHYFKANDLYQTPIYRYHQKI